MKLPEKLGALVRQPLALCTARAVGVPTAGDPLRYRQPIEYSLKVYAQFQLGETVCHAGDPFPGYNRITLPQPKPRNWQAFAAQMPTDGDNADDVAYWLITQRDFAKI